MVCNLFDSGGSGFSFFQGLRLSVKHRVRHGPEQLSSRDASEPRWVDGSCIYSCTSHSPISWWQLEVK